MASATPNDQARNALVDAMTGNLMFETSRTVATLVRRLDLHLMEVLLARENGFCFGVKKAVELTEAAAETGRPVFNLGQVVHNPKISERLAPRGVKVVQSVDDIGEGIVGIRAHGVPPETRAAIEAKGLECV